MYGIYIKTSLSHFSLVVPDIWLSKTTQKSNKDFKRFLCLLYQLVVLFQISFDYFTREPRSCLYEKNHPTQVRRLTWARSRQNGVFHFVKTNRLYENGLFLPRWDLTSPQVRFPLGGMIFLHVNNFCRALSPRQDCSFSLGSVCFYNHYVRKCNWSCKI